MPNELDKDTLGKVINILSEQKVVLETLTNRYADYDRANNATEQSINVLVNEFRDYAKRNDIELVKMQSALSSLEAHMQKVMPFIFTDDKETSIIYRLIEIEKWKNQKVDEEEKRKSTFNAIWTSSLSSILPTLFLIILSFTGGALLDRGIKSLIPAELPPQNQME